MTVPEHWIEQRREDGELVGWIVPEEDGFRPIDLLGRVRTAQPIDWLPAEELLDELGIGYLADPFAYLVDGEWRRVRLTEVSPEGIGLKEDDFGAVANGAPVLPRYRVPFPIPTDLVPLDEAPGPVRSLMD